ncbi:DNA-directed RNA polymerase sigma-70 factor [Streptomyces sp. NPDC048269]|uniref:RNA polymerase sigma factor n=1 Tax=Streptomyces sp. NPDC048269 TaxID=3155753 RepID=UPI0034196CF8
MPTADPAQEAIGAERPIAEAREGLVANDTADTNDANDAGASTSRATPQGGGPGAHGLAGTYGTSGDGQSQDSAGSAGSGDGQSQDSAGSAGSGDGQSQDSAGSAGSGDGQSQDSAGSADSAAPAPADEPAVSPAAVGTPAPRSPAPRGAAAAAGTAPASRLGGSAGPVAPATRRQAPAGSAEAAFDALYAHAAPDLIHQAYLLTGRRAVAQEAVERAFRQAWRQWPEVATDPDPVGWVRAVAYEHALAPWHHLRAAHRHPDKPPAEPADRILLDALLSLPTAHRRTVVLYDGVGLDLPDTAAETEASTPTAGGRLLDAHAYLAERIPGLADVPPEEQPALLHDLLSALVPELRLAPRPAALVRGRTERRTRALTRAALGMTSVIAVATAYTAATAPTHYQPPIAPGSSVSGVPPLSGPQQLTERSKQLHDKLRADPAAGPARLAPRIE